MEFGTLAEWATAAATVGLAYLVVRQVRVAKAAVGAQLKSARDLAKADHDRRQKQATLEFYRLVMSDILGYRRLITEHYGTSEIPRARAVAYHTAATTEDGNDHENDLGVAIRGYLNGLERLAVGTNIGVLDEDVLQRIAHYRFVNAVEQFRHYINEAQKAAGRDDIYGEFLEMALRWGAPKPLAGGRGEVKGLD